MKPYLAVDIETSGLSIEHSKVLQLAAIWDDLVTPIGQLKKVNVIVDQGAITYAEPYAVAMNGWIFKKIAQFGPAETPDIPVVKLEDAKRMFHQFVQSLNAGKSFFIAGKNAAGFDVPIMRNNGFSTTLFKHRVIDPGSLYLCDFGYPPSLDQINALLGTSAVSHNALDDCFDVIRAIRHKLGVK